MFVWQKGDLNDEQEAAITEPESVFLVACPGSGKTRTLTYKIAYELSRLESDKKWVVAITYTNRAADEIHERIENLGVDTSQLWIGTIHAFCLEWIIKPYSIYHPTLRSGYRVISGHDSEQMLTELCKRYSYPKVTYWDCGYYFTPTELIVSCAANKRTNVYKVLDAYYNQLASNKQIDFELILKFAHELIEAEKPIAGLLGGLFSYVLIDEYQDTKEIQYAIISSILKASNGSTKAFVVGDPNQAIYGSLGGYAIAAADLGVLSGVPFRELSLSRNYRSSDRLVGYFGNYRVFESDIEASGDHKHYPSIITLDGATEVDQLEAELVRLVRHSIEDLNVEPSEICILAPQWVHLAAMTRRLVGALPEYNFDGPGMVPFARDIDNFWYKLSKIILTSASPKMYVRRLRWAGDILTALGDAGIDISGLSRKSLLRHCNSITVATTDGLSYLAGFFDELFDRLEIDFRSIADLYEPYVAFFDASTARIVRLKKEGAEFISDITTFRKVFESRSGITVSTIHGVKGAEFDVVIAFALLQGMVPHFTDADADVSANKLLYVICSRARKNLHLISECDRRRFENEDYVMTHVLQQCAFTYD